MGRIVDAVATEEKRTTALRSKLRDVQRQGEHASRAKLHLNESLADLERMVKAPTRSTRSSPSSAARASNNLKKTPNDLARHFEHLDRLIAVLGDLPECSLAGFKRKIETLTGAVDRDALAFKALSDDGDEDWYRANSLYTPSGSSQAGSE